MHRKNIVDKEIMKVNIFDPFMPGVESIECQTASKMEQ